MDKGKIKKTLADARHAIGHAYAFIGVERYVSAQLEIDRARKDLQLVDDALDESLRQALNQQTT